MDEFTSPEFERAALVTVDTQNDVLDDQPFGIPGTSAVLPNISRLVRAHREAGRPVVHVVRLYRSDGSDADLCRRAMLRSGFSALRPGSQGAQLAPGVLPDAATPLNPELLLGGGIQRVGDHDFVIYKPRWGAFFRTPLEEHLRALEITTIVFAGCNFPNCPRTSIYEASERDFRIVVAGDAISGMTADGRNELANIGVVVLPTADIVAAMSPAVAGSR
jgi:nicotinamidase-related amidase